MAARWRLLVPGWLRRVPADLAAVGLLVLTTAGAVFLPVVRETPLRILVGLPFVLFLPGYAFIAALFPEAGAGPTDAEPAAADREDDVASGVADDGHRPADDHVRDHGVGLREGGIDGIERVALAFGTSIAIVPLLGLVLNFTPWGIRLVPIVLSIGGFTIAAAAVATVRRAELPAEERFTVPYRGWWAAGRAELLAPETRVDAALNVLLVASILLAVASVGYAVAVPKQGEAFTEFYLLTEDPEGDLVADDYPTNFTAGTPQSLVVGIGNHEHERTNYTVVVAVHDVRFANNTTRILDRERLHVYRTALADNETWHLTHTVAPTMTGTRLRLTYLLYRGETVPPTPTVANAYRETHLWVNVSAA